MFSTETYFYLTEHGLLMLPEQYAWLEADLAAANANRAERPWVLVGGHRPLYCSPNDDNDDCHSIDSVVRTGILGQYAMEPLLAKYGVDLVFVAHEHAYSRSYPVYNRSFNASGVSTQGGVTTYNQPNMPIHIITGAAGCPEDQDPWHGQDPWQAFQLNVYGYGRLSFPSPSIAKWEFVNDANSSVVDTVVIVQDSHGPFTPPM